MYDTHDPDTTLTVIGLGAALALIFWGGESIISGLGRLCLGTLLLLFVCGRFR